jgi:transposase-like protein
MCTLTQARFQDDTAAREYLEATLWPNGPVCPHCAVINTAYITKKPGLYRCGEKECRKDFTVTVGTVFERSKVPLHKWLLASFLLCSSKKGMSAHQLHRTLGVTYKTVWFMAHRIREAMDTGYTGPLDGDNKPVEVDETYWGNNGKQAPGVRGGDHKMKIVSLVERDGNKRSFHVANVTAKTVTPILKAQIAEKSRIMTDESRIMTDESRIYTKVGKEFASHESVNHSAKEYARGDVTTNSAESSFALLKRGLIGTFHHVSEHLQRYATEFDFRWNTLTKLGFNDTQRAEAALKGITGKRLTYKRPVIQQTT